MLGGAHLVDTSTVTSLAVDGSSRTFGRCSPPFWSLHNGQGDTSVCGTQCPLLLASSKAHRRFLRTPKFHRNLRHALPITSSQAGTLCPLPRARQATQRSYSSQACSSTHATGSCNLGPKPAPDPEVAFLADAQQPQAGRRAQRARLLVAVPQPHVIAAGARRHMTMRCHRIMHWIRWFAAGRLTAVASLTAG